MVLSRRPRPDDVKELLLNAELRDELEPYYDEAISRVNVQSLPISVENEFLASMLAWERAPVLPIYRWFDPELRQLELLDATYLKSNALGQPAVR